MRLSQFSCASACVFPFIVFGWRKQRKWRRAWVWVLLLWSANVPRGEYGCGSCLLGEARLVGRLFWGWSFFTFHRWTLAINLSDKGIVWFNSYSQIIGSIHFPGIDYLFTFISNWYIELQGSWTLGDSSSVKGGDLCKQRTCKQSRQWSHWNW